MKDIVIIVIILFSTCHLAIGQNISYSMQEPVGYCYDIYSYQGQDYPVCYRRTQIQKNQFHFNSPNRHYIMLYSEKYSSKGYNYRTLLYDIQNNSVNEIDSCKTPPLDIFLQFLGTDEDTLYVSAYHGASINAINLKSPDIPVTATAEKSNILRKVASIPNIDTWCVPNSMDRVAYADRSSGKISIVGPWKTDCKVTEVGEVITWKDSNTLLYASIIVEGYGDFYYDLWEYSVNENRSKLVAKHLDNIFDYYDGVLVYEKEPNILCLAELGNGMLSDFIELDLSDSFTHIYSAYMLNRNEMIVGGDRPNFESFYYKLSCAEKR